ncbi:PTS system, cellobiose-specific IIC component [Pediococcus damnosus]|uniref:Permease IIC component n=1 Tax=Pediococcus damnosus TaxID=51663 RepID=A0A143AS61_9LACO|nr:PTS transporter subunit EIIC [Pediococcus damnosus]AMV63279.1 PTS system, cellobiose-specific IIC component [Pediococcus damnosus]AMV66825.1 PTS system, cellobiose-specific IIC component [Pediococcus damnosus]AMV69813.1 PTS system, cellobiose-specific IIC component [Pediococcus damnosus]KJU74184.1 PTS lactose transporter subunit IIC [Pediococcus damnosus LMG 28219]PIO81519.1 PTS cellobiose transporter subunit IIC [Pediococcus damnosus]
MHKIIDIFQNKIIPPMTKVGELKYLVVLRDGMIPTIIFTVFGSIFLILSNFPIPAWQAFVKPYQPILNSATNSTIGLIGLVVAIGISYQSARANKIEPLTGTVIGVIAYMIANLTDKLTLNVSDLGSSSIFSAILVCILASELVHFAIKRNWTIKLPDTVPPAVGNTFSALIPGMFTLMIVWIIRVLLRININQIIQNVLSPIIGGLDTIWGVELVIFLTMALWFVGAHGTMIIGNVASPIFFVFLTENMAEVAKGQAPTHIAADGFLNFGMTIGGTGAILGLVLCMFTAKSQRYKAVRNVGFVPSLFNISEPIMFGFPVVLNTVLLIPMVLIPMILQLITWYFMEFGVISHIVAAVPWVTPIGIMGFLMTGGDWRAGLWQLIEAALATIAYYPFFRALDSKAVKEENENAKKIAAAKKAEVKDPDTTTEAL